MTKASLVGEAGAGLKLIPPIGSAQETEVEDQGELLPARGTVTKAQPSTARHSPAHRPPLKPSAQVWVPFK